MSEITKVVFLSYASPAFARALRRGTQDADAARCGAESLRSAGVEVSFDQGELLAGDASLDRCRPQA